MKREEAKLVKLQEWGGGELDNRKSALGVNQPALFRAQAAATLLVVHNRCVALIPYWPIKPIKTPMSKCSISFRQSRIPRSKYFVDVRCLPRVALTDLQWAFVSVIVLQQTLTAWLSRIPGFLEHHPRSSVDSSPCSVTCLGCQSTTPEINVCSLPPAFRQNNRCGNTKYEWLT